MPFFGVPIRNGLPIGLGSVAGFGVQQFDPSQLFEGGTVAGAWYDPSDLSTMFDTSAGTTPVAMPGQGAAVPVGLMLDKSQGLVLGSELLSNTGGPFVNTTGWSVTANGSVSVVNGNLRVTNNTATVNRAFVSLTTVVGQTYLFETNVAAFAGGLVGGRLAAGTTSTSEVNGITSITGTGVQQLRFRATATTTFVQLVTYGSNNGGTVDFSYSTVRELPGNHAIAFNNTTARPELRARVNLLVATAILSTQSVTTQATSYTLSFAGTGSITLSGTATGSYSAGTHTITCTAGTLTLTVSGTVTTADLRPANSGALLPAYQAVVDANTYDTSGFPLYLYFDGTDDSMYTPANLNLSSTDKVAVFAGVRKLSDASYPTIAELSASAGINNGSFAIYASGSSTPRYGFYVRGTATSGFEPQTYAAPASNVLACAFDIAGAARADEIQPKIDGVLNQTNPESGANAGTGNFGTYPLYIGSRNNTTTWLNGHLHSLIIAGSAVSAGNISATEQWVAQKTGIAI